MLARTLTFSVLLLISLTTASVAFEKSTRDQCSPVDFRKSFDFKMRNQNEVSWCFAHAAADYLQHTFQIQDQISAADIAINYSQTSASKLIRFFKSIISRDARFIPAQTGFIKIAVDRIIPQGYCPESVLPSDQWERVNQSSSLTEKVEIRQAILDTFEIHRQIRNHRTSSASEMNHYYRFKNIDRDHFFEILKNSPKSHLMLNLRTAACLNERRSFNGNVSARFIVRNRSIFQQINHSFDQGKPVTIDFFGEVLRDLDHFKNKIEDLHTVLLYGRRFNPKTQQCEYLVKDSYGEQCSKYDPKIDCESGNLWIPETRLHRSLTSILTLNRI